MKNNRKLTDLVSVGPATAGDMEDLGITEVEHLIDKDPTEMYERLQKLRGQRIDPCVSDVFHAAVAQARDPKLPKEKCDWWYWSKIRKQGK